MSDTVLVALISSGAAIISGVITGITSSRLTIFRIDQLERKVEKHNNLVERMVAVEQSTKSAHHRIDGLERVRDSV
jgi:cell division protein FtsL